MLPTLEHLQDPHCPGVLFECIAGSRAYGTSTATSDVDLRGIFLVPARAYLSLRGVPNQLADERNNTVFYSLRRTLELLAEGNPNLLEILYMPADCVQRQHPAMALLLQSRARFLTRQCVEAHLGYAFSQIKKAKGQSKWINNPKPERLPQKEDYCRVIPHACSGMLPGRPVSLTQAGFDLTECHVARVEHARDLYRLYHYGPGARGVFRGDALACESIPVDDEQPRFVGLLLYNEQAWRQASEDHRNYWTWRRERNEDRWRQQETGELDYDAKNLMHTIRLLRSGQSIIDTGQPIVRFDGEDLATLMRVRSGHYRYDEIMALAETIVNDCRAKLERADLPPSPDTGDIDTLLETITRHWSESC